jgi:hypothetical protein
VIVIKKVNLKSGELSELTKMMGDEIIHIPKEMLKNNIEEENPEVVRIGNILPDGSTKDSKKEGDHWHQDGSLYCKHHMSRIITLLHTKVQPLSGGSTIFMDLQNAWEFYK